MAYPTNFLQQVITYQESGLAYLENICCLASTFNAKFKNFQDFTGNLGSVVDYDLPYQFTSANGLVAQFQGISQRVGTLAVNQATNTSYTVTNQQQVFNLDADDYMRKIGIGAIKQQASKIEINLGLNFTSAVVDNDPNSSTFGQKDFTSGPFRFYGNGVTPINSYQQLEQIVTNYQDMGTADNIKMYIPHTYIPPIIGSGLTQFAPVRNNKDAQSWEIGDFGTPPVTYYKSNLFPQHTAGTVGNATGPSNILTVVSTNDPTGANITQIVFSGATASDVNALKAGDLFQFNDATTGLPNLRYLTRIGQHISQQPVQCRVNLDVAATAGGQVTVSITPALVATPGGAQNLNTNIVAGMKMTVMPSHRAGCLIASNAGYLAMPRLPDEVPFPTASEYDMTTGLSLRMYYGALFGQNQRGMVHDNVWGSRIEPEYAMRILFPLS